MFPATSYECIDETFGRQQPFTLLMRMPQEIMGLEDFVVKFVSGHSGTLNLAVAGCSTGEEVYSYALLLAKNGFINFRIDGYDLYEDRLEKGRKGSYGVYWGREADFLVSYKIPESLAWVEGIPSGHGWDQKTICFSPEILARVNFIQHDFSFSPFPRKYDLITLENVFYQRQLGGKARALKHLWESLNEGGYLIHNDQDLSNNPFLRKEEVLAIAESGRFYLGYDPKSYVDE